MVYENKLGLRLVAFIIDYLCLQIVSNFLINLGVGVQITLFDVKFVVLSYWQSILLYFIYFVGFALFNKGTTVGKMILNLKIVQTDFEPLSGNKLIVREIFKVVFMPICVVSFVVSIVNTDNKAIHDMLIDSIVVKEKRSIGNLNNTISDVNSKKKKDDFLEYNTPNVKMDDKVKLKKKYLDPLDENPKRDDESN